MWMCEGEMMMLGVIGRDLSGGRLYFQASVMELRVLSW